MNEHVLVVDDNRDTADGLARLISSFGYQARAVYGGEDAVRETAAFQPDMALVDIGMPDLDGYETVKRIRQERGNVHVIIVAVTGWSRDEDKRRAYEAGFDLHVAKPMDADKLKELLALLDPENDLGESRPSARAG
jgi:CheY-like chemotaxis protein